MGGCWGASRGFLSRKAKPGTSASRLISLGVTKKKKFAERNRYDERPNGIKVTIGSMQTLPEDTSTFGKTLVIT